jgi:hypothetical protein
MPSPRSKRWRYRDRAPPEHAGLPDRLRERLIGLGRRARAGAGLPTRGWAGHASTATFDDQHLRGRERRGPRAQFIDWNQVGVGPFSYDLSTFLFGSRRPSGLDSERYRQATSHAGWRLPAARARAPLLDTAERAGCANRVIWPVLALLQEPTDWAFPSRRSRGVVPGARPTPMKFSRLGPRGGEGL